MVHDVNLTKVVIFKGKQVRKTIHNNEWWFSVVDVVGVLTDSENSRDYWYKMKIREQEESKIELSTICRQLKLGSSDGKKYLTDCANAEGVFRIIQSIPSPKAEPFKLWLARVGKERLDESQNKIFYQRNIGSRSKQGVLPLDIWGSSRYIVLGQEKLIPPLLYPAYI